MREADRDELQAAVGVSPYVGLSESLAASARAYTLWTPDDEDGLSWPIAMYGIVEMKAPHPMAHVGIPWLLGTDDIHAFTWPFLRSSRAGLAEIEEGFDVLTNFVDERNVVHIRWLSWLGFHFIRRVPEFGFEGRPFLEFVKVTHV